MSPVSTLESTTGIEPLLEVTRCHMCASVSDGKMIKRAGLTIPRS